MKFKADIHVGRQNVLTEFSASTTMRAYFALSLLLLVCAEDLPSWVPPPGTFASISLNFMKDVDPCPSRTCVYSPSDGIRAIFAVWNGGIYAPDYSKYGALVVHGGGHAGYSGNEAYAFDLTTRLWNRVKYPSNYTEGQIDTNGELPDGQPFASHTYTGQAYLSPENGGGPKGSYIRFGFAGAGVAQLMHRLPLDTPDDQTIGWIRFGDLQTNGLSGSYWSATYDVRRRRFWVIAGGQSYNNGFGWVDLNGNVTMLRYQGGENWSYTGLVYSPSLDVLTYIGYSSDTPSLAGRYAGNETMGFQAIKWNGTFPKRVQNFEWSTMGGYYVCYEGVGSYVVHRLVPPAGDPFTETWTWIPETLTGVDGAVPAQLQATTNNGIWSRFREVPSLSTPGNPTFVFADGEDQPVQLWRLSGNPPPQVNIPIAPVPPLGSPFSSSNPQSPSSTTSPSSGSGSPSSSPRSSSLTSTGARAICSVIAVIVAWLCLA